MGKREGNGGLEWRREGEGGVGGERGGQGGGRGEGRMGRQAGGEGMAGEMTESVLWRRASHRPEVTRPLVIACLRSDFDRSLAGALDSRSIACLAFHAASPVVQPALRLR